MLLPRICEATKCLFQPFALFLVMALNVTAAEPLVGAWRLADGRLMTFTPDHKGEMVADGKVQTTAKWESDPFSEVIKRYAVTWTTGQVFDVEVSKDGNLLRGSRYVDVPGAPPVAAERVEEMSFALWVNDQGTLAVNGKVVASASLKQPAKGTIYIRVGDAISIDANNRSGVIELGFECTRNGDRYLTAGEMYYTTKPSDGWRTGKIEFGYRRPLIVQKKGMSLGKIEDVMVAVPQREDVPAKSLYYKFVVR